MKGEKAAALHFDRTAHADLWRNTISQIPSVFGRLVYLASLRNPNNGSYEHHGLAFIFSAEEANKAIKKWHQAVFSEWLGFNLEQQKADLDLYISSLFDNKKRVIETWSRLAPYRNLIPASAKSVEERLYLTDFKTLLELLKAAYGVSDPDPSA